MRRLFALGGYPMNLENLSIAMVRWLRAGLLGSAALACLGTMPALAQDVGKPNFLLIWGDDIGWFNVSAYNRGMMGYGGRNRASEIVQARYAASR